MHMVYNGLESIDWDRFVHLLDYQLSRQSDLREEQLEALTYMKGYASYNRRVKSRVPVSMLNAYINTFASDFFDFLDEECDND